MQNHCRGSIRFPAVTPPPSLQLLSKVCPGLSHTTHGTDIVICWKRVLPAVVVAPLSLVQSVSYQGVVLCCFEYRLPRSLIKWTPQRKRERNPSTSFVPSLLLPLSTSTICPISCPHVHYSSCCSLSPYQRKSVAISAEGAVEQKESMRVL